MRGKGYNKCVGNHGDASNERHNREPNADVGDTLGNGPSEIFYEFCGIQTHFQNVVDESKKWRQRESSYKDSNETVLKNCKQNDLLIFITLLTQ